MFDYFKDIFSSANDQDPASVRLLRVVLTASVLAAAGAAILLFLTDFKLGIGSIGSAILSLLTGLLLFLSYRNLHWPGRMLMPLVLLIAFAFIAISVDGLHGSTTAGFVLVIVLASLLAGQKAIPLATILALLGVSIVAYADMTGINKSVFAQRTDWAFVVVVSVIQIVAAVVLNGLMTRLNSALKVSRNNELAQIKSNQELRDLQKDLEQRVAERTRGLELAAEVGRLVSQVRALDVMLKDAAEIIRSKFNLYYTQVYLIDPGQTELVLQAGTGTVGAELLGRGHRLPFDPGSINGRAAAEKHSVVITDTTSSTTFRPNPLLPDTRSEMAVPLMLGDKVVGVLDLQSNQAGMLSQDVLPGFEALAGQLAVAIQNANLLAETEQARQEVEKQARRQAHINWNDYMDAIHTAEHIGFVFEKDAVTPLAEQDSQAPAEGNTISASIAVAGEPLGSITAEVPEGNQKPQNSELIQIIARQVAQQIESLRLLESAERYRHEAEESTRRLTREGWESFLLTRSGETLGYMYDLKEVVPATSGWKTENETVTLPIKVRDETIGKVAVAGIDSTDSQAMDLAAEIAERLGMHIESLRQFDQTQSALSQSEKLFDASSLLTQAKDLSELTASTVKMLGIPAINRALLVTFNYDSEDKVESFDVIANWWNGTGHPVTPVGTHYSREMIQVMPIFISPTPVFTNDTFADERVDATTMEVVKRLNLRTMGILPLHSGTRQIGALLLEGEEPHNFMHEEIRFFTALAPQIATVLENRRQFERAQKQAEREATLNAISQKIQSATSVEAVLQIAARELGHALGAPRTIAQLSLKDKK